MFEGIVELMLLAGGLFAGLFLRRGGGESPSLHGAASAEEGRGSRRVVHRQTLDGRGGAGLRTYPSCFFSSSPTAPSASASASSATSADGLFSWAMSWSAT